MGLVILAGDLYNAAARGTLTVSPTADPLFLSPKLIDGYIDEFWSQDSIVADSYIRCDLNVNPFSGFEATPFSTGYTMTTANGGTVTLETGIKKAGAQSAKMATSGAGGTYAGIERRDQWRSGQKVRGSVSLYLGGGGPVKLEIRNLMTGNYLAPGGTWQAAQIDYLTTSGSGAFEDKVFNFTVESWTACQGNLATVYCRAYMNTASGTGYVDEMCWWPEVNLVVLTSHNVDPITPVQWRSSTDNFGASDVLVVTVAPRAGVMYSYQSAGVTARYAGLKFVGTPLSKIRATEVVWGYGLETMLQLNWDFTHSAELKQVRTSKQSLAQQDFTDEAASLSIDSYPDDGTFDEFRNELLRRTDKGQTVIVIPHTTKDPILIGRRPKAWAYHATPAINSILTSVEPFPKGIWTP